MDSSSFLGIVPFALPVMVHCAAEERRGLSEKQSPRLLLKISS